MRLIGLAVILVLSLALAPLAVKAQPVDKTPRIGVLVGGARAGTPDGQYLWDAFLQGLRAHGYVEGQNIVIEWRYARGGAPMLPGLAAELVRLGVDLIVVGGGDPVILVAKEATGTIPIVMAVSTDPVGTRLITSLARPGGNVTGSSIQAPEGAGKRLELLKEAAPRASRVAVLWNAVPAGKVIEFRETQVAARALGVTLQSVEVRGPHDFDRAFSAIATGRPDALIVFSETLTLTHRQRIVDFAARSRLPMISETRQFAAAGGLLTYGASLPDLFRRAAYYVDKILKGAKPADLPVEQPAKFELVINLKTAKTLGLTIPQSILVRADEIIQ